MGVLFGAYFGYELMPALWFNYHGVVAGHPSHGSIANIMDILKLTVLLGVGVISAGLLLNWINRIRTRAWKALFFAKEGVLGGIIYGTGVWVAYQFLSERISILSGSLRRRTADPCSRDYSFP